MNSEMIFYQEKLKKNIYALIESNRFKEAKEVIGEYENIVSNDIDIYSIKGVIAMMENNTRIAEETLQEGLVRHGENFDLLYNLGYLYENTSRKELAIEYYKKALKNANTEDTANGVYKVLKELNVKESKEEILLTFTAKKNKEKLHVVFFPYKVSMWDSLATIYEAASKDEDCIVHVVPIPYYQLSQDKAIPTYEGDRFPSNIPITHYSEYNIEDEKPDIVFVHNIYDQYNTITRVYDRYFTSNLRKYTDMLVYVPYHIPSLSPPFTKSAIYTMPSVKNVDKIILINDYLKEVAIKDNIPESKLIALGSPKIDSMINNLKGNKDYPKDWEEKLDGKTVYTLNTGCLYFVNDSFSKIEEITNILNITNINKNTALIWRPHPLTKISIMKYSPQLLGYYNKLIEEHIKGENRLYNNVIFDETDNYLYSLNASDVLISGEGSLLGAYLLTEKKIIFMDKEMPKGSVVPDNAFYYFYNEKEPWYELVGKINEGYDPLAKNRKGLATKVYKNSDGTSGEKIYKEIKYLAMKK